MRELHCLKNNFLYNEQRFFNKENNIESSKNTVVSIAYQVRTQDGVLVDEAPANQPLEYLQGHNNLIIGLENALEGKEVGDKFEVRVQPEEGYGEYNENMVQRVPKRYSRALMKSLLVCVS